MVAAVDGQRRRRGVDRRECLTTMAIATINPATGERLREFSALSPRQLDEKLGRAWAARLSWKRVPVQERAAIVRRAGDILEQRKEDYGRLMTLEMGKTLKSAIEEAAKCATGCRYYADRAADFLNDELVDSEHETGFVTFQPLGVVLAIMPWNFPF